jgi:peptide deformylase
MTNTKLVRALVPADDPILRLEAGRAPEAEALFDLIRELLATMLERRGVGLAAPQIGVSAAVAVMLGPYARPLALVNPVLLSHGRGTTLEDERCLSLPGVVVPLRRWDRVTVLNTSTRDRPLIELRAGYARVAQHEIDHLRGVLISDPRAGVSS